MRYSVLLSIISKAIGACASSSISSSVHTSTLSPTSSIAANCNHDNCLRQFIQQSSAVSDYCSTFTATSTTASSYPTFVSNCGSVASRISSACSCIVTGVTASSTSTPADGSASLPGSSVFTVPAEFPTGAFSKYYVLPGSTVEPQPMISSFPLELTDPNTIPLFSPDFVALPDPVANNIPKSSASSFFGTAYNQVINILNGDSEITGNCAKCVAALSIAKLAANVVPEMIPGAMVAICKKYSFSSDCEGTYNATNYGGVMTQVIAFADITGADGQAICAKLSGYCDTPTITSKLDINTLFPKPKPANAVAPPASGKRVKVMHLSDFHLDPRYDVGSEAQCSNGLCCRSNTGYTTPVTEAAPLFGTFNCDSPYYLVLAALQAIRPLTGTNSAGSHVPAADVANGKNFAWSIYTGDLVSHDPQNELSMEYVEYTEISMYGLMKKYIDGPIYVALGNHDTNPQANDASHSLPGSLGSQMSWNYDLISTLWESNGWVDHQTELQAKAHYGAYSTVNEYGLRVIVLNSDFWYVANYLTYINTTNPDVSGTFEFLINELQAAEDAGERVWIVTHVLTGWDGSNAKNNPSDLFYQIVERYSPHVIANMFFGHTHEDQFMVFYNQNGTIQTSANALATGWIGPSVTPRGNMNSGWRMYEVDTGNFEIYEAYTFYSDVNTYTSLGGTEGPVWEFEYSTREAYADAVGWGKDDPLNATFWHEVTVAMEKNGSLVEEFTKYQGKSSVKTAACDTSECWEAKICYMRSGSAVLGKACKQGYSSVQ